MAEVQQVPDESRYVVLVDGSRVGQLDYAIDGEVLVALHTEVDPAYAGQGLAARLVERMLSDVRASGRSLRPHCPYVRHFVERHPEYADLVASDGDA